MLRGSLSGNRWNGWEIECLLRCLPQKGNDRYEMDTEWLVVEWIRGGCAANVLRVLFEIPHFH
jgi:hypothetical protein